MSVHNTFEDSETDVRDNGIPSLDASESDFENYSNQQEPYHIRERQKIGTRSSPGSFPSRPPLATQKMSTKAAYSRREYSGEFNLSQESPKPTYTKHESLLTFDSRSNETSGGPKDLKAIYTEIAEINAKLKVYHRQMFRKLNQLKIIIGEYL